MHANKFNLPFDGNNEYIHVFPHPGTYHFSIWGQNSWCGGHDDTTTKTIVVPGCHADAKFVIGRDTTSSFAGTIYDYSTFRSGASYMWHFGDGDSSSSRTPMHIYSGAGIYVLCLTIRDSICVSTFCDSIAFDTSGSMIGATTPFGIQVVDALLSVKPAQVEQDKVSVYPNPGKAIFTVKQDINPISQVRVFDLQGKQIIHEQASVMELRVDLSSLRSGVYIFAVTDIKNVTRFIRVMKI